MLLRPHTGGTGRFTADHLIDTWLTKYVGSNRRLTAGKTKHLASHMTHGQSIAGTTMPRPHFACCVIKSPTSVRLTTLNNTPAPKAGA
jgi:hypothetical protein